MERMTPKQQEEAAAKYNEEREAVSAMYDWAGWELFVVDHRPTQLGDLITAIVGRVSGHAQSIEASIDVATPFILKVTPAGPGMKTVSGEPWLLFGADSLIVPEKSIVFRQNLATQSAERRRMIAYARFEAEFLEREVAINTTTREADNKPRLVIP
jgi:hypothetical protein